MSDVVDIKKPLYPWFGSKRRVADVIWRAFGDVRNFVDPFMGTCSVLLAAPWPAKRTETVNDLDHFIVNAWRSMQYSPDDTAVAANWIVSEADLAARHYWLVTEGRKRLVGIVNDPRGHDPEIAGWWLWGQSSWIAGGWCAGAKNGWCLDEGMQWVRVRDVGSTGQGVKRQPPHLASAGQGVKRQLPYLASAGQGVNRQLPHLGNAGQGVNRQLPHLASAGQGATERHREHIQTLFRAICDRLRYVRICCGDWKRVLGPAVTTHSGMTAVILDPPYSSTRANGVYAVDSMTVANDVREWAIANGNNPLLRIALCGHEGEHDMPDNWSVFSWSASGGYSRKTKRDTQGKKNKHLERIWFSPHCVPLQSRNKQLIET